jgi:uncharacterized membrane protein
MNRDRDRLEAFSDGVIAVAITLLALNLGVAGRGHGPLLTQLFERWPSFVAYLISFFTIGIIWVNHHALIRNIAKVTRTLLFLNLLLLLFVVMVPFATATMAEYVTDPGPDGRDAMVLFALVFQGMGIGFSALFLWSFGEGRTHAAVPSHQRTVALLRFSVGTISYLIAIVVAFVSPLLSLAVIGLVAVYYIFENTPTGPGRP